MLTEADTFIYQHRPHEEYYSCGCKEKLAAAKLTEQIEALCKIIGFARCRLILHEDHTGVAKLIRKMEALGEL